MKKLLILFSMMLLAFQIVACGSKTETEDANVEASAEDVSEATEEETKEISEVAEEDTEEITEKVLETLTVLKVYEAFNNGGVKRKGIEYVPFSSEIDIDNCKLELGSIEGDKTTGWVIKGRLFTYNSYGERCYAWRDHYDNDEKHLYYTVEIAPDLTAKCTQLDGIDYL